MPPLSKDNKTNVLIALNHYPIIDNRVDYTLNNSQYNFRNYDLIMEDRFFKKEIGGEAI